MSQRTPQLLTVKEAAQTLRIAEWTLRAKVRSGEIPALRVGSGPRAPFRIDQDELAAWLYADPKETDQ